MLYPDTIEERLGFDRIRDLIAALAVSPRATELLRATLRPIGSEEKISLRLEMTDEMMRLITDQNDSLPLSPIPDFHPAFARTAAAGSYLDQDEAAALRQALVSHHALTLHILALSAELYPHLHSTVEETDSHQEQIRRIDQTIDRFGQVRDTASEELAQIRREMREAQNSVARTLQSILRQAKAQGIIEPDIAPTLRQGRLMLPVPAAEKRQIPGIVHDESATGRTAYIEPQAVVELNNRLRELESREAREIVRVLTILTDDLRPCYDDILRNLNISLRIDALHAIARYSLNCHATIPQLTPNLVDLHEARHPLLEQSLAAQHRPIVPLDIRLTPEKRLLVISGPNAGGKSVCLKTLGLLQYMLLSGLPIPVADGSRTMLFHSVLIDIGDQQNLDNDLSTYSSHILNMATFIRRADRRSLILIDELGSGTEPTIGGAIAEAVLERLNRSRTYGIVTTHYANLKNLAARTPGLVNGAMLYDRANMQPLFTLSIGQAGSSFAIDIARKTGLQDDVIRRAIDIVGSEQIDSDRYLEQIARDKHYWQTKREQIEEQRRQLEEQKRLLDEQLSGIKAQSRDILARARQQASGLIDDARGQIEQTIRQIKEADAERTATREARRALEEKQARLNARPDQKAEAKAKSYKIGDTVAIEGQQTVGRVIDIQGRQAVVLFGQIKTTVEMSRLNPAKAQRQGLERQKSNVVDLIHTRQTQFSPEIDLRGMRVDEAMQAVVSFLDDAQMLHARQVRILHGTGTGALRQSIRQYLQVSSVVESFRDEYVQLGGAGITVVTIRE